MLPSFLPSTQTKNRAEITFTYLETKTKNGPDIPSTYLETQTNKIHQRYRLCTYLEIQTNKLNQIYHLRPYLETQTNKIPTTFYKRPSLLGSGNISKYILKVDNNFMYVHVLGYISCRLKNKSCTYIPYVQ